MPCFELFFNHKSTKTKSKSKLFLCRFKNSSYEVTYELLKSFLFKIKETCLQISSSSSIIKILDI